MEIKAIHIHTDHKFVGNTQMFEGEYFSNICIYIGSTGDVLSDREGVRYFERSKIDLKSLVDLCSGFDLVVLYDLDMLKMQVALSLPKTVKIAWRFFGYELYSKRPDLFKSEQSRKYDALSIFAQLRKKYVSPLKQILTNGYTIHQLFHKCLDRIDCFFALSHEEYELLKSLWPKLPAFVKLPHYHLSDNFVDLAFEEKAVDRPIVIVGNNRSSYNNHLDVIQVIDRYGSSEKYTFSLLFSYGQLNQYANEVLRRTNKKPYYHIVDQYMDRKGFESFYKKASALVINGYRQMAGANIRMAFQFGLKVYMNDKNIHKTFLENEGFKIFSIDDFEDDLKISHLGLDTEVALHNFNKLKDFRKAYTRDDFQRNIYSQVVRDN